jgi:hypothetical protein
MARRIILYVADDATVNVTGTEYGEREEAPVSLDAANRVEIIEQAKAALVTIQGHIDDVQAELSAWASKDAAGVKSSLGTEVLPALIYAMQVQKRLIRLVVGDTSAID